MRNVLIIAGEASGDLYGAHLARELKRLDPDLHVWGCGGPRMADEGVELIYTTREFAVLGFAEIARHLPFFIGAMKRMKRLAAERRPAVVVPIDYPGFNMRFAAWCSSRKLPVAYYVSPQVWAWGWGRVARIRKVVSRMIVTFPFEEEIYRREDVPVAFAGHPLVDLAKATATPREFRERHGLEDGTPVLGLFPGSRSHEVEKLLPPMLGAVRELRRAGHRIAPVIGAPPASDRALYHRIPGAAEIPMVVDETYDLLGASLFALVASGTMTVEAACLATPMVIVYKVAPLSWALGRLLVRVPHVGMANLLAGERVVPELLQGEVTAGRIAAAARPWLDDPESLEPVRNKLLHVRRGLGAAGASRRAAELVLETAEEGR